MNGLGNSSDVVGWYLYDLMGVSCGVFVFVLMNRKIYNEDGVGGMYVYFFWWLDNKKLDFFCGYYLEIWGGLGMFFYGFGFNVLEMNKYIGGDIGGYGIKFWEDVKWFYGVIMGIVGCGEVIV